MRDDGTVAGTESASRPVACAWCGTAAAEAPVTWTIQTGPRGIEHLCEACTRTNVRQIEGQLPTEWW
jgi:hypothetical protein